jgi:alkanesulfonate monooxygenase SsuD/methylene tetrahydromethanopterin reductase-like flavin-dependent oxidoreductase (luciferase family)
MTFESIEVMTRLWSEGPIGYKGEYWAMGDPNCDLPGLGYHLRPLQTPHPPIAIAGLTARSANHKLAGEKGYIPVSLSVSPDPSIMAAHWDAVVEGASRGGRAPSRAEWRIIRDVFVAPTDAEPRELAISGMMGRCWREFMLPIYLDLGLGPFLKRVPSMPDEAIYLDYLADNLWLVGSPETVARSIIDLQKGTGGFGYLVSVSYDARDKLQTWERSQRLLAEAVRPRVLDALGNAAPLAVRS